MPADSSGREIKLFGEVGSALRTLFQDDPGNGVTCAVRAAIDPPSARLDFHNTSMTYFPGACQVGSAWGTAGADMVGVRPPGRYVLRVLYRTLELTVAPVLRLAYRPEITGLEHVPRHGSVILAGNHISFSDEIFTPLAARRQVTYLAKAEYFDAPGLRGKAMAAFFNGLGHVPVDRESTRAAAASIEICVDVLAQGRAFGIFPEGTRSPDGQLYKFRTGVSRVALRTGAPVVPVGIIGTREVNPAGSKRWHRAPVAVHFGAPMYFGHRAEQERSSRALREVAETVRAAVQALSGQSYVDAYGNAPRAN